MFWRVASFNQTSPVEAVLDRPDFTLEDLLEEDDLIQVGSLHSSSSNTSRRPTGTVHACLAPLCSARRSERFRPNSQECKALNARLIDFLKQPEAVAKLLEYITQPAGMDADDKRQFKYPFSACEVSRARERRRMI